MVKKTINPTKKTSAAEDINEISQSRSWEDMLDDDTLALFPGRDEIRKRLAYTLLKWSDCDDSIEIGQFCKKYKIPFTTLKDWVARYPDLKEAYNIAKYNVGVNRRVGVITKRYDGAYAYRDMHCLDNDWLEINQYNANLKKSEVPEQTIYRFVGVDGIPLNEGGKLPDVKMETKEEFLEKQRKPKD